MVSVRNTFLHIETDDAPPGGPISMQRSQTAPEPQARETQSNEDSAEDFHEANPGEDVFHDASLAPTPMQTPIPSPAGLGGPPGGPLDMCRFTTADGFDDDGPVKISLDPLVQRAFGLQDYEDADNDDVAENELPTREPNGSIIIEMFNAEQPMMSLGVPLVTASTYSGSEGNVYRTGVTQAPVTATAPVILGSAGSAPVRIAPSCFSTPAPGSAAAGDASMRTPASRMPPAPAVPPSSVLGSLPPGGPLPLQPSKDAEAERSKPLPPREPLLLGRDVSASSGTVRIRWTVDAKKLKGTDKIAVSPAFEVPLFSSAGATFRVMIMPKVVGEQKGGGSFRKSKGKGSLQLKCETQIEEADASETTLAFRLSLVDGKSGELRQGTQLSHNFADNGVCASKDEWDFAKAVDEATQTFAVTLEALPSAV